MTPRPGYIRAAENGILNDRIKQAEAMLEDCTMCPRNCRVNRNEGETGICATGANAMISSFSSHFGEETCISGTNGSGTIFFTNCSLLCCFCQNFEISHGHDGQTVDSGQLASVMLHLQESGCHNINLVTPSHVITPILKALNIAVRKGLCIPLVYNSSGYDSVDSLRLLDGIIDIYMPDFKFWDPDVAEKTCHASDYPGQAKKAVREMHRQTGNLCLNQAGIAVSGLLVRHLVLPDNLSGTEKIMDYLVQTLPGKTHVHIMSQYRPMGDVEKVQALNRPVSMTEFRQSRDYARKCGLELVS